VGFNLPGYAGSAGNGKLRIPLVQIPPLRAGIFKVRGEGLGTQGTCDRPDKAKSAPWTSARADTARIPDIGGLSPKWLAFRQAENHDSNSTVGWSGSSPS
jgi:hypothetical protein